VNRAGQDERRPVVRLLENQVARPLRIRHAYPWCRSA
jgi:hypothetical protein